ncbi:hypothetical protein GWI33_007750 [Rhynchophorus ferrugineus]|uniref:Uncharacterized protein n=1 Tax=Rhynchophorus ferrugineus TaxID=354439 RepID=A0A834IVW1_RHYFE|nr:hypothetical protein GWI33_007750 [Rhynchophorus ferrugineus]
MDNSFDKIDKSSPDNENRESEETKPRHNIDLGNLTNDIVDEKASLFSNYQERATQGLGNIQTNFFNKEGRLRDAINSTQLEETHQAVVEYENILRNTMYKLRQIAEEDFRKTNEKSKILMEDAKHNIKKVVEHCLRDQESRQEFSETAEEILVDVRKKVQEDFYVRTKTYNEKSNQISQRHSNIFVLHSVKPAEEVEAEKLLQQYFEAQLLDYVEQFKNNFKEIQDTINSEVNNTTCKIMGTVNQLTPANKNPTEDNEEKLNFPTKDDVEKRVSNLLNKAKTDFQQINESIKTDVAEKKERINSKAQFVAEKIFGKKLLGIDDDA